VGLRRSRQRRALDRPRRRAAGLGRPPDAVLGVHPDFQRQGLGRAILAAALRRLQAHGAQDVYVETDNTRDAALLLYESAGFRVQREVLVYRKDYPDDSGA
jgi:ribosomal protein S18 acetylase RimI-like enzyme